MIQLSIIRIDDYGPWTHTLGFDREHKLQSLQSEIYSYLHHLFSKHNAIVFQNRGDEFFAITNGMSDLDHIIIKTQLNDKFNLPFSITFDYSNTPLSTNLKIHKKHNLNINSVRGNVYTNPSDVMIMHIDIDGVTHASKSKSPYEISSIVLSLHDKMSQFFLDYDSLTFFMGGDNYMVISTADAINNIKLFLDYISRTMGITLNCGIGHANTARHAVELATKSLDTLRDLRKNNMLHNRVLKLSSNTITKLIPEINT
ncbi:MAG: GTP cyclohydrolase III [Nitrosopumilus sp.]|nr:GTP cyclohydrolase III [Nitrosopumilus sp.]